MYANENDDRYPEARVTGQWGVPVAGWVGWMEQIFPYTKNQKIYRCPRQPREIENAYSYFLNDRDVFLATGTFVSVIRKDILLPAQFILAGDSSFNLFILTDTAKDNYTQDCLFSGAGASQRIAGYHLHKLNILFGDGHVKAYDRFVGSEMTHSWDQPGMDF